MRPVIRRRCGRWLTNAEVRMRVLILCAGEATRWGNFRGVPKHLVKLLGEPILHRAVRLIKDIRPDADVRIIAKDPLDPQYQVAGARTFPARLDPTNHGADKFLSSRYLWDADGRTVILYGDCFFTRAALTTILTDEPIDDGWRIFARFDGSTITGSPGGENFAHVIDPDAHHAYEASLHRIAALQTAGVISRCGGWEQYRSMHGVPDEQVLEWWDEHSPKNPRMQHVTEIDDATEDMDTPRDWMNWSSQHARYSPELRAQFGMV
jgi:hypothetical protein